ncbi:hypothetical protein [Roseibium aggregatum]|uniref:Uncharacterized protein n=1 Tax=Roseibium aggregatum TaxID=187304 RepID=A0A0M6YB76_9HYPH|nr:hypothetical protein [Roseibium aggregatum]CTQ47336.1 hypothetical protein LAL4801_05798 [Roseibium aggregatum]
MAKCPAHNAMLTMGLPTAVLISSATQPLLQGAPELGRAIGSAIRENRNVRREAEWDKIFASHLAQIRQIDAILTDELEKVVGIDVRIAQLEVRSQSICHQYNSLNALMSGAPRPASPAAFRVIGKEEDASNAFHGGTGPIEELVAKNRMSIATSLYEIYNEAVEISYDDQVTAERHLATQINLAVDAVNEIREFVMSKLAVEARLENDCIAYQSNLDVLRDLHQAG